MAAPGEERVGEAAAMEEEEHASEAAFAEEIAAEAAAMDIEEGGHVAAAQRAAEAPEASLQLAATPEVVMQDRPQPAMLQPVSSQKSSGPSTMRRLRSVVQCASPPTEADRARRRYRSRERESPRRQLGSRGSHSMEVTPPPRKKAPPPEHEQGRKPLPPPPNPRRDMDRSGESSRRQGRQEWRKPQQGRRQEDAARRTSSSWRSRSPRARSPEAPRRRAIEAVPSAHAEPAPGENPFAIHVTAQLPRMPATWALSEREKKLDEALLVWPHDEERRAYLQQHPSEDEKPLNKELHKFATKRTTKERQWLGSRVEGLEAAMVVSEEALRVERTAREKLEEEVRKLKEQLKEEERRSERRKKEREAAESRAKDRDSQAAAALKWKAEADSLSASKGRVLKGALVLATIANHEARHHSLWRQTDNLDSVCRRSMHHWLTDRGYASVDAPHPRPIYYDPSDEPGFPRAEEVLNQQVGREAARGAHRGFFVQKVGREKRQLDMVDIDVPATVHALENYVEDPAAKWAYYTREGPAEGCRPEPPWAITGPYASAEEAAIKSSKRPKMRVVDPKEKGPYVP